MRQDLAIRLFNEICQIDKYDDSTLTPIGALFMNESGRAYVPDTTFKECVEHDNARRAEGAAFLRKWADAIEGKED